MGGQTLLPNDICHSFNTVNWTSLTYASTITLSPFASEGGKGPVVQSLCAGTSRSAQDGGSGSGVFGPQPGLKVGPREMGMK